ncbi:M23 family metallopeptidase [Denitrobaculum tricleocarpae]|uniref:M23 family metallopeptidase n=1 Tax=Denitrobaculum tricleocarpae TaxID=2591009 RepID=A0A545U1U0_9PROT|nr:M23 family metallopeptidase [Denitrobaculum tricleocarpae]TQV83442.1 M23 family metallopeptidase [Denitrobaculum tricleocarpae]
MTWQKLNSSFLTFFLLLPLLGPAHAAGDLILDGNLIQGGLIIGTVTPGAEVQIGDRVLRVSPEGRFVLGFGRDAEAEAELNVTYPDGSKEARLLPVKPRTYDVESINGVPQKYVSPPEEVQARIRRENEEIARVRAIDLPEPWFENGFVWPVIGRISGVYGSQRIFNGEPRRPHFGVDIAAPKGTPIAAPADGVISLAEPDLYYSGGTVILDHGHGLTSTFLHMDSISVEVGQKITQGTEIGTLGSTGRSSGPHLDWRMNWFEERIDPQLLAGPMPATN